MKALTKVLVFSYMLGAAVSIAQMVINFIHFA
jgi:hypothetical protein